MIGEVGANYEWQPKSGELVVDKDSIEIKTIKRYHLFIYDTWESMTPEDEYEGSFGSLDEAKEGHFEADFFANDDDPEKGRYGAEILVDDGNGLKLESALLDDGTWLDE